MIGVFRSGSLQRFLKVILRPLERSTTMGFMPRAFGNSITGACRYIRRGVHNGRTFVRFFGTAKGHVDDFEAPFIRSSAGAGKPQN